VTARDSCGMRAGGGPGWMCSNQLYKIQVSVKIDSKCCIEC